MIIMLTHKELLEKWNGLGYYQGGFVRIDDNHPADWYIGYDDIDQKTLLFIYKGQPVKINSSKSIITSSRIRDDGKAAITFKLIKKEQEDVFIHLCWDIIEHTRTNYQSIDIYEEIIERYHKWQRLMENKNDDIMSNECIKGLIGELIYLEEIIDLGIPHMNALNSWVGPDGSDQDFIYNNCWAEIKAIGLSSDMISISSLEQLDSSLPGKLVVYYVDMISSESVNGFTLMEKVNKIKKIFADNSNTMELFENKLYKYGFSSKDVYNIQKFKNGGKKSYVVNEEFPRLIKSNVPVHVTSVQYSISLSSIEKWKVLMEDI